AGFEALARRPEIARARAALRRCGSPARRRRTVAVDRLPLPRALDAGDAARERVHEVVGRLDHDVAVEVDEPPPPAIGVRHPAVAGPAELLELRLEPPGAGFGHRAISK